jgi:mannose-6-phosphate isomerase-like protein (cupin superfamily)
MLKLITKKLTLATDAIIYCIYKPFKHMFVKKHLDSTEFEAADNTILSELVNPLNDDINIGYSVARARLPLGRASLPHRLSSSELYYILNGKGRLHIDHTYTELEVGDSALVPANALQFIENISSEELVFLCIVEPYWRPETELIS